MVIRGCVEEVQGITGESEFQLTKSNLQLTPRRRTGREGDQEKKEPYFSKKKAGKRVTTKLTTTYTKKGYARG